MPDLRTKRLKEEPHRSEILTQEQIDAVRRHCRADRWPVFWTLLATGARQGEVLNLRTRDIALAADQVAFRSQPGSKGRGMERWVPIPADLAACLRTLAVVSGDGPLFTCRRTTLREWWAGICRTAAIRGVSLHGIRATYVTRALDNGVPPVEVQKLVGHSGIAMTMRYYRNSQQSQTAAVQIHRALGLVPNQQTPATGPSGSPSTPSIEELQHQA